jgi:EAL domain-containing protein (putative c-di-GMP-specific phosphodiesterase class I)
MIGKFLQEVKAGSYIFREGDIASCAYIVEKGAVLITVSKGNDSMPVSVLGPGDLIGEMAIIDGLPHSASAFASEDCLLSIITKQTINEKIDNSDPTVRMIVSVLVQRLRNANLTIKGELSVSDSNGHQDNIFRDKARKRLKLENELLEALMKSEFFLVYQPIVDLVTSRTVGFEALIRWNSPTKGLVPPSEFIDVAEETSVIIPIGDWVLEQGFKDLKIFQESLGMPDLFMSLNVSVRQFADPDFGKRVKYLQKITQTESSKIKLEMTERVLQEDSRILDVVRDLRQEGFNLSIDDFGTGYSSLTSLFSMEVNTIKIDKSFVNNISNDPKSRAIVQAVMGMAVELGIEVVAEGIEKKDQATSLMNLGCRYGQGYFYSKPKKLEDLIAEYLQVKKAA